MRKVAALLLTLATLPALADDFKVIKLEQDVRNLERQVQELTRQLTDLQRVSRGSAPAIPAAAGSQDASATSPQWLDAANWKRIRVGMTELEVIGVLGPPTTLRGASAEARTLMYAMEIGASGFLSGSVQLQERRVVNVQVPTLR
jgi:hypothetical protein